MMSLDREFGSTTLSARMAVDRYLSTPTKGAPSSGEAIIKLLAYRIVDVASWIVDDKIRPADGYGNNLVKERVLEMYPVRYKLLYSCFLS